QDNRISELKEIRGLIVAGQQGDLLVNLALRPVRDPRRGLRRKRVSLLQHSRNELRDVSRLRIALDSQRWVRGRSSIRRFPEHSFCLLYRALSAAASRASGGPESFHCSLPRPTSRLSHDFSTHENRRHRF